MRSTLLRIAVVITLFFSGTAIGRCEELSPDQKAVWQTIEGIWRAWQKQDVETVLGLLHPDYSSWSYSEAVPGTFSRADAETSFKARIMTMYHLTPLQIKIYGNSAFIHFRYTSVVRSKSDGQERGADGRFTDILIKQNGKWLVVGEHGGRMWPKP